MKRTSVNPVDWGLNYKLDQGEIVEGATRHLRCSGQVSIKPDPDSELGVAVVSPDDLRGQIQCALANVDAVLKEAGMDRSNIVMLRFFTTEIDGVLENYDVYAEWITPAGTRPPQSLIGVARLFLPELKIEIEIEAAA